MAAGGAFEVSGTLHLAETLRRLADPAVRQPSGAAARRYVEAGRGAAERGAEIIERLVGG